MANEKMFQKYFLRKAGHGYRISLTTGGGFPDVLLIHGDRHSLVELKMIEIGPSGDKKIGGIFKATQPPWYMNYLANGGTRLFVVFHLNSTYGVVHVDRDFVMAIDSMRYSDLPKFKYKEFDKLTDLIEEYLT